MLVLEARPALLQCRKWIGSTDAATVLRAFGVRAHIIDFLGKKGDAGDSGGNSTGDEGDGAAKKRPREESLLRDKRRIERKEHRHQALIRWVWDYFAHGAPPVRGVSWQFYLHSLPFAGGKRDKRMAVERWVQRAQRRALAGHPRTCHGTVTWAAFRGASHCSQDANAGQGAFGALSPSPVTVTSRPPLYFQHEGHSRTIVGIEKHIGTWGESYNLLLLDPVVPTRVMVEALQNRCGSAGSDITHGWPVDVIP